MSIEDKIFNQLVRLDILNYVPIEVGKCHVCTCCGRMASWKLSDEASDAMDAERPYLYICGQCHDEALAIVKEDNDDG